MRVLVEYIVAGDLIQRYGWWYKVLEVQPEGDNIRLSVELCGSRLFAKTKELIVKKGTKILKKVGLMK